MIKNNVIQSMLRHTQANTRIEFRYSPRPVKIFLKWIWSMCFYLRLYVMFSDEHTYTFGYSHLTLPALKCCGYIVLSDRGTLRK